ncbi:MAG: glycine--tRNA ligase subunit beta [Buchnera aphidicola (Periphyllus lyropictus)]|uniref:glycine--tRNA ligase subunit beta n=1 Tax=Buchnera aphidicola TaxID=9 RepID=UPI001EC14927|nr:glycine--tRNA ligase subunit beta [Buchnera aphidicola]NIH16705.1 glycine--tRNA ligase subunit beta [Buchnera aphidicola (Periphyllus lyropictus)]USS94612.1 glycine--tRNA ligase subunit beta [Buchnera aphidicola (Periphyllus lyropictus)]
MKKKIFLFELGTENLPAKTLKKTALSIYKKFKKLFKINKIYYKKIYWFATSRRLAIKVKNIEINKEEKFKIIKGPVLSDSFNKFGKIKKPLKNWMKKLKISINQTEKFNKNGKEWIIYKKKKDKKIKNILIKITKKIVYKLSHPNLMRWNKKNYKFIRPVRNVLIMLNKKNIKCKIFNLKSNKKTQSYLFNQPKNITINHAKNYPSILLKKGKIIADYNKRKLKIKNKIKNLSNKKNFYLKINNVLLNEINSLVEQPNALIVNFKKKFLNIPKEIIIHIIEKTLKSFPLFKKNKKLKSSFIIIINNKSKNYKKIILGYKSVIESKLQDVEFFLKKDIKNEQKKKKNVFKKISFHQNLGTLHDKIKRLKKIIIFFSKKINFNIKYALKAAFLCKNDITSNMVSEFPEMQGIIGAYYEKKKKTNKKIYKAIKEHYKPRYNNDKLPKTPIGIALSISDKIDNLIGMFIIGNFPKGDKDPYALRRKVIGIIKIIIKNKISFNLNKLIKKIIKLYNFKKKSKKITKKILKFIVKRFYNFFPKEKNIKNIIKSISLSNKINLIEIYIKIKIIIKFIKSKISKKILMTNKRIYNILKKNKIKLSNNINYSLLKTKEEKTFIKVIKKMKKKIKFFIKQKKYKKSLKEIIKINKNIENFFKKVIINHNEKKIRKNRLNILNILKNIFSKVALFSYLY